MASVANSSTSICGIDVGSENCYVAVARQGGIEILLNEYSQRSTPAYIGFGGNQRELGVSAKQKQMMNLSNTCVAPTLIIGKKFDELDKADIPYNIQKTPDGGVSVVVNHNEELSLMPTQVLAMLFTKLRQISGNVIDCVINCPNYFTEIQKRSLIDAAVIAGLNPLKVIPDMTAIALYYGFYRTSSSGQESSIVTFVDCGQTSIQTSVVLFNHKDNSMHVLDAGYVSNIGGKHFDEILADHFIQQKNLKLNKRARYRLIAECEKLKKQMSANSNELPINIECLYEDRDFSARTDRTTFEELSMGLFAKIKEMLASVHKRAIEKYDKDFADKFGKFRVDSVEVVGGTSRIPMIKKMIKEIFTVEPSTTLNADEAVARGCALQCAILSPTFKVARELKILDSLAYQINFRYSSADNQFKTVAGLYPRGHQYPFTKQISIQSQTLPIRAAFDFVADNGQIVPYAEFEIREPDGSNAAEHLNKSPIKLRVRVDQNGLVLINSASISYEAQNEPMEVTNDTDNKPMETDDGAASTENNVEPQSAEAEPKRKSKPKTLTVELVINPVHIAGKLPHDVVQKFLELESNLILADKNWKEKTDAKNALEEFIYEWRDRLESGSYDAFINPSDKGSFQSMLGEHESWLYKQDEEEVMHSKSVYDEKTNAMKNAFADRVLFRKREFENRPRALEQLGQRLQQARKLGEKTDPEEADDIAKFTKEIDEKVKWFDETHAKLTGASTYDDPLVKCEDILQQLSQAEASMTRLNNSRSRRAEQKRKEAEKAAAAAAEAKKAAEAEQKKQQASGDDNATPNGTENGPMEVDPEQQSSEQTAA